VIVEAKIGHILDSSQVDAYRSRLGQEGLLAVLVPIARRGEGERVVEDLRQNYERAEDPVRVCLWTWDEVVAALESTLQGDYDVVQLRGLIEAAGALDIRPFDEPELNTANDSRFDDLWIVLDRASWKLFDRSYRSQSGGPFTHYRHVSVGDFDAGFTVGIGRQARTDAEPWVWARIADTTHLGPASQTVIKRHRPDAVRDGDGLAFPLLLEPGLSGDELTQSIRGQLEDVAALIREGLRESLEELNLATVPADKAVLVPLVGMEAFALEDLLDSGNERRRDLETVARQVARHIAQGGRATFAASPPFALRFWTPVHPYTTFLSIGIERTDNPGSPQPWVWLTLHQGTPRAAEALQALEAAFPGEVVPIPEGWGIPMGIPEGGSGVVAFHAYLSRVEQAKAALRIALRRIGSVE
jgi:Arc/MetJ-type ribon-helix-helix transcriptional regulator